MSEDQKPNNEQLKHMPSPYMNMERMFVLLEGEARFFAEMLKSMEDRLAAHDQRVAEQKPRLRALIEQQLPTNGRGEITAQRLREVFDAVIEAL